jgi:mRNA interferase MazF
MTARPTPEPRRGEIWLVNFDPSLGAELQKTRPAVVVSVGSVGRLPLRIVVPVTSWDARYETLPWFVRLTAARHSGLDRESGADTFQVKSVAVERFHARIGEVSPDQLEEIVAGIALCVGFRPRAQPA